MKKVIVLAAFAMFAGFAASAQQQVQQTAPAQKVERAQINRDPAKIAEMRTERLAKEVKLTDEQKKQVYDVYLKSAASRPAYTADARDKMQQMHAEEEANINKILTPEQANQYKDLQSKREAQRKEMMEKRMQRANVKAAPAVKTTAPAK